ELEVVGILDLLVGAGAGDAQAVFVAATRLAEERLRGAVLGKAVRGDGHAVRDVGLRRAQHARRIGEVIGKCQRRIGRQGRGRGRGGVIRWGTDQSTGSAERLRVGELLERGAIVRGRNAGRGGSRTAGGSAGETGGRRSAAAIAGGWQGRASARSTRITCG